MNNDNIMNETEIFKLYVLFTFYNERYIQRYCIYVCYLNVNCVKTYNFPLFSLTMFHVSQMVAQFFSLMPLNNESKFSIFAHNAVGISFSL